jgi:hypothetical protein
MWSFPSKYKTDNHNYINITITILDITHRPVLYLKLNRFVRTSQETHYVSATSPTG